MIERLALEAADRFAMRRTAGEHQSRPWCGMVREDLEHPALIIGRQVEERIPGDQSAETASKCELAHVGDLPVALGKALPAQGDHRRGGIDAGDGMALFLSLIHI